MSGTGASGKYSRSGKNHEVVWWSTAAASVVGVAASSIFMLTPIAGATPSPKVTICHATSSTSNPYTSNSIDTSSVDNEGNQFLNGHGDHTGPVFEPGMTSGWGDIIPPFTNEETGSSFPGMNWDAAGQVIWANGCRYAAPSPTPTPTPTETTTESPTPTPTPTPTVTPTPTETPTPTQTPTPTGPPLTPIITDPPTTPPVPTTTPPEIIMTPPVIPIETPTPPLPPVETGPPTETVAPPTETVAPPAETQAPSPTTDDSEAIVSPPATEPVSPISAADPDGIFPVAVDAGGGTDALATSRSVWLWLIPAGFLALAFRSIWQLSTRR